jgi:organic radical activating enzyme
MAYAVKEIYFTLQGEGEYTRFMSLFRTVQE